jgi:hypothetical protein
MGPTVQHAHGQRAADYRADYCQSNCGNHTVPQRTPSLLSRQRWRICMLLIYSNPELRQCRSWRYYDGRRGLARRDRIVQLLSLWGPPLAVNLHQPNAKEPAE